MVHNLMNSLIETTHNSIIENVDVRSDGIKFLQINQMMVRPKMKVRVPSFKVIRNFFQQARIGAQSRFMNDQQIN